MNQNKVCAYLDLLGFQYYISKDLKGALTLLQSYHAIIRTGIFTRRRAPDLIYVDKATVNKTEKVNLNSFEYFLPFSDSIFIQSSSPDQFIRELSVFLLSAFLFMSKAYDYEHLFKDPAEISKFNFDVDKKGKVTMRWETEYWFPLLFRGGLSFGECQPIEISSIINNERRPIVNLVGKAVVEAVQLETSFKGPRLACSKALCDVLSDELEQYIVRTNNNYEILWPAFIFTDDKDDIEMKLLTEFEKLFLPALNLWKAYNHLDFGIHYYNLLKLIIQGTLHYFSFDRKYAFLKVQEYIYQRLYKADLKLKEEDLMGPYFS